MSSITEEDALKLLEIKKGASLKEITDAFRVAAMKAHPDKGGSPEIFKKVQLAKEKLVEINHIESTSASVEQISQVEDIKGVIVVDDSFYLLEHEQDFRAWRKPNLKVMSQLAANHRNKETEMVVDYCKKGYGGSYQAIESYIRDEAGITSPYHMNERVLNIKRILENFRKYMQAK